MPRKRWRDFAILSIAFSLIVAVIVVATTLIVHLSAPAPTNISANQSVASVSNQSPVQNTPGISPTPVYTTTPVVTATPAHTPTPKVTATAAPGKTPVLAVNKYVVSGNGQQATIATVITWYGYNDNSGATENQHGSAAIAYPRSDGYPTLHSQATEGTGSYNSPITFAAPNKDLKSSFPIGSVIYVPLVKKYFIMEDLCGDNDPNGCQKGVNHADLWMGPDQVLNGTDLENCEDRATPDAAVGVIINPSATLPVDTTQMYTSGNACSIHLYN